MNQTRNYSPGYIDDDEASDLCIKPGWYLFRDGSIAGRSGTLAPFTSEQEARMEIPQDSTPL